MPFSYFIRQVNGILRIVRDQKMIWRPEGNTHHVTSMKITSRTQDNAVPCATRIIQHFLLPSYFSAAAQGDTLRLSVENAHLTDADTELPSIIHRNQELLVSSLETITTLDEQSQEMIRFPVFSELSDQQLMTLKLFMRTLTKEELNIFLTNPVRGIYPHAKVSGLQELLLELNPDKSFEVFATVEQLSSDLKKQPLTPGLSAAIAPKKDSIVPYSTDKSKLIIIPGLT
jgi:hypothetical protein